MRLKFDVSSNASKLRVELYICGIITLITRWRLGSRSGSKGLSARSSRSQMACSQFTEDKWRHTGRDFARFEAGVSVSLGAVLLTWSDYGACRPHNVYV